MRTAKKIKKRLFSAIGAAIVLVLAFFTGTGGSGSTTNAGEFSHLNDMLKTPRAHADHDSNSSGGGGGGDTSK